MSLYQEIIDRWIHDLPRVGIVEQLRARNVTEVELWKPPPHPLQKDEMGRWQPLGILRMAGYTNPHDRMVIALNENDTLEGWIWTVGHELAHTFEVVDQSFTKEINRIHGLAHGRREFRALSSDERDRQYKVWHEAIEKCCDDFAFVWLCSGWNYPEIKELLHENFIRRDRRIIHLQRFK